MRSGFGLIQALMVIVLVSGIMTIAMKYATVSVKQTGDLYVRESAELFMNSAVELALLAIQEHNRSNGCLKDVNITSPDKRFVADINISKYYVYDGKDNNGSAFNCESSRVESIQTEDSHGMVMLQVKVETNSSHPKNYGKVVKLNRRTLQRP
jgi:type II secretory pathway pseudopilin PulG